MNFVERDNYFVKLDSEFKLGDKESLASTCTAILKFHKRSYDYDIFDNLKRLNLFHNLKTSLPVYKDDKETLVLLCRAIYSLARFDHYQRSVTYFFREAIGLDEDWDICFELLEIYKNHEKETIKPIINLTSIFISQFSGIRSLLDTKERSLRVVHFLQERFQSDEKSLVEKLDKLLINIPNHCFSQSIHRVNEKIIVNDRKSIIDCCYSILKLVKDTEREESPLYNSRYSILKLDLFDKLNQSFALYYNQKDRQMIFLIMKTIVSLQYMRMYEWEKKEFTNLDFVMELLNEYKDSSVQTISIILDLLDFVCRKSDLVKKRNFIDTFCYILQKHSNNGSKIQLKCFVCLENVKLTEDMSYLKLEFENARKNQGPFAARFHNFFSLTIQELFQLLKDFYRAPFLESVEFIMINSIKNLILEDSRNGQIFIENCDGSLHFIFIELFYNYYENSSLLNLLSKNYHKTREFELIKQPFLDLCINEINHGLNIDQSSLENFQILLEIFSIFSEFDELIYVDLFVNKRIPLEEINNLDFSGDKINQFVRNFPKNPLNFSKVLNEGNLIDFVFSRKCFHGDERDDELSGYYKFCLIRDFLRHINTFKEVVFYKNRKLLHWLIQVLEGKVVLFRDDLDMNDYVYDLLRDSFGCSKEIANHLRYSFQLLSLFHSNEKKNNLNKLPTDIIRVIITNIFINP